MAWIESHQALLTHRKTIRASNQLKVSRYLLIGHLHALWWWALDNAEDDGELGATTADEIAEACGWPVRKATALVDALTTSGFIDMTSNGMRLHNWYRYAGKLNEKKAKDRARKSEVRGNSTGIPLEVAEMSQAPNQPTVPTHQTQPTRPDQPTDPADAVAVAFGRFGKVTAGTAGAIDETIKDYGIEWTQRAVKEAARGGFDGAPPWSYVDSICDRWQKQGGPDDDKPRRQLQTAGVHAGRGTRGATADDVTASWERYAAGQS